MAVSPTVTFGAKELAERLSRKPRVSLADLPTPLLDCPRLTAAVGGPRILIKRDDLTGLAFGGNKSRGLEFILGQAQAEGADTLITSASSQSNLCRQTAAAGARLGFEVHVVLAPGLHNEVQGNLLLDHVLGANVHLVDAPSIPGVFDMTQTDVEVERLTRELAARGRKPYVIRMRGHSQPLSGGGYLNALLEMEGQFEAAGIRPTHIVTTSGSGGTHAALALGVKALGLPYEVVGISIRKPRDEAVAGVAERAGNTASVYDVPARLDPEDVVLYADYRGDGYGLPTDAGLEAIRLVARTTAVLLDPVYTGKAMSGLIDLARRGVLRPEHTAVFVHTGGTPGIFAYHRELMGAG